jgi:hypothetical protein
MVDAQRIRGAVGPPDTLQVYRAAQLANTPNLSPNAISAPRLSSSYHHRATSGFGDTIIRSGFQSGTIGGAKRKYQASDF